MMRVFEIEQSMRIIEQTLDQMPEGPIMVDDPKIALPPKEKVYDSIEGLVHHFNIIVKGIRPPKGEVYQAVEGGNGELGFYVVSDGSDRPWKCRCRGPCFPIVQSMPKMLIGSMIADIIPTFGMVNMIGGEMDR
jgi:NADH-quinone oxidoreductase subunit D